MSKKLIENVGDLVEGKILNRENRFLLKVLIASKTRKVYLPNPGALSTVLSKGRRILSKPVDGDNRKTDYTAFAIDFGGLFVTVNSFFSNEIFSKILDKSILDEFKDHGFISREPTLPTHGRADFLLKNENTGKNSYVEIKSCTHVENGIGKFPDRPPKRGRRHLRSLMKLSKEGFETSIVFIIQRPDGEKFRPFRKIDPKFSDLLSEAMGSGVYAHALSTRFDPPRLFLEKEKVPIEID